MAEKIGNPQAEEERQELDLEQADQVSGGTIGNAVTEDTEPIDDDTAQSF